MVTFLKKVLGKFRKKPKLKLLLEPEEKKIKKTPWSRECFSGLTIATETEFGFDVRLTKFAQNKMLEFKNSEEIIAYLLAFMEGSGVEILFNICNTGPVSSSVEYAGFKLLVRACLEQMKQLNNEQKKEKQDVDSV